ncbi:lipoate--protein ligase family protein [candidate division BRC1 bacterium HGW-BRC1-1]|nr:MAG: lipoate--protein ligase family protein [candidate division BRC1 bacterium HGW-BRC1-1]
MNLFDMTLPRPEENLALDEALLEWLEPQPGGEALRFWESSVPFVVLGAGGRIDEEVHTDRCADDSIPVLRRCSGGGTVMQGPGCLNFTLVLDKDARPEMHGIESTNTAVLGRIAAALRTLGHEVEMRGTSDLTAGDFKFSGNAQRRKKTHILFHGTILHNFAQDTITRYLREPPRQPDYRDRRAHAAFVRNLALDPEQARHAIAREWDAQPATIDWPRAITSNLMATRYTLPDWHTRF